VWRPNPADDSETSEPLGRPVAMFGLFRWDDGREVIHGLVIHPDVPQFVPADTLPGFAGYMRFLPGAEDHAAASSGLVLPR
jgi:hypothetical protein